MAMASIKNGYRTKQPEIGEGVVKVVVIGEPQVGKTTFIHAYYNRHEPGPISSFNAVRWFPCEFEINGEYWRTKIFRIPGDPRYFLEQRRPHYESAKVIVLMYSVDDPLSLELLTDKWLPEVEISTPNLEIPLVVVGNKTDLRDDPEVIERLALDEETPETYQQAVDWFKNLEIKDLREISSKNLEEVDGAFNSIFNIAVQAMV